jgi:hypothetical protein
MENELEKQLENALFGGSRRCGGAASTTDGNSFAFGNTLEWLLAVVLGKKARGAATDPPLDRRTGLVRPRRRHPGPLPRRTGEGQHRAPACH